MRDRLIIALDVPSGDEAVALLDSLGDYVPRVKIGLTLFAAEGPPVVARMRERGSGVFLDLKLHDIPHQVDGAVRSLASLGVEMLTVHASGGVGMMRAAVAAADEAAREDGVERPAILAVTVLTSMDDADLARGGIDREASEQVVLLARLAAEAGVDGVVCSPHEASQVREVLGPDALVVTPGVRPVWAQAQDQSRFTTPAAAMAAGASHLVVGRPITGAIDPHDAFERIAAEIGEDA